MNNAHPRPRPRILFVCIENAGRSQLAEAFAHIHGSDLVDAASAGSHPAATVNPRAVAALAGRGYDLAACSPKGFGDVGPGPWDYVVTMGCGDACPYVAGARTENWELPDPRDFSQEQVNAVADEIERRVMALLDEIRSHS